MSCLLLAIRLSVLALVVLQILWAATADASVLSLSGILTRERAAHLELVIRVAPAGRDLVLDLNSPGGSVEALAWLIDAIDDAGRRGVRIIAIAARCDSACALLWAAAPDRRVRAGASLGLHACSRTVLGGVVHDRRCSERLAALLRRTLPALAAEAQAVQAFSRLDLTRWSDKDALARLGAKPA